MRLTQTCIDRLVGKTIGIVNREEPKYNEPQTMVVRVQGYVKASMVGENDPDAPADVDVLPQQQALAGDDDIPF
jgi:hypothetical protein